MKRRHDRSSSSAGRAQRATGGLPTSAGSRAGYGMGPDSPAARMVRRLRRLTWTLVAAAGAMGLGVIYGPALQRTYYLIRLNATDSDTRVNAMNHLAQLTRGHPDGAARLAEALAAETTQGDPDGAGAADEIAAWAVQHNESFRTALGTGLDGPQDQEFLIRAMWLERVGDWRRPQRSFGELLRRERLRLQSPDPVERRVAIHAIVRHRIDMTVDVRAAIVLATHDDIAEVRRYAAIAASICLGTNAAPVLVDLLQDPQPPVRREAVLQLSHWAAGDFDAVANLVAHDLDAGVREAACWVLGGSAAPLALPVLTQSARTDPSEPVRRMATWGLGQLASCTDGVAPVLASLLSDTDEIVAWRAARGATGLPVQQIPTSPLLAALAGGQENSRAAVATALGRCPPDPRIRDALGDALSPALSSNNWPVVLALLGGLGAHGDGESLRLLSELVSNESVPPIYRWEAARLVSEIDAVRGWGCLQALMADTPDEVRELAAWWLSRLAPQLESARIDDPVIEARAIEAWAMALAGACERLPLADAGVNESSSEASSDEAEPGEDWKAYGYELYARVLCGDEAARPQLDTYILNQHVSRVGIFVTLLEHGESLPLDLLLGDDPTVDVRSLLVDARVGEVFAYYRPDAPRVSHEDDPDLQRWQLERLRDFWQVYGSSAPPGRDR
ncbi:MAG: HEAT repeat domain-containing protein [Planctomycetes bacterium]|nr:HEAT repeat domain-containing protein [Planctomycetota bacterium]